MDLFKNKRVKSISIGFENCESFEVPADAIETCYIDDIRVSLDINYNGLRFSCNPGEMISNYSCNFVRLILNKKAFDIKSDWDDGNTLHNRIDSDITHIDIIFNDDTSLYIYVPWLGDDMYVNDGCSIIKKNEAISIAISEDKNRIADFDESFNEYYEYEFDNDVVNHPIPESVEIGQIISGSTYHSYDVPNYVEAALNLIRERLNTVMWNINQKEYESPFSNTCNEFHCDTFDVEAYSWDEDAEQPYNFKWKDYEISWYKYFGRGMTSNRQISTDECAIMLDECLKALYDMQKEED